MSAFSATWLTLREPADHRARSPAITGAIHSWAARLLATRQSPLRIVDLGAGTGSNLRYLAPRLPASQIWTLIDNRRELLAIATECVTGAASPLLAVEADLATESLAALVADADLVSTSALLDLTSQAWCESLVAATARPGRALHAALSYDGCIELTPSDPFDSALRVLINRHQRLDKGFGPALGPGAVTAVVDLAAASGAAVRSEASGWRLGQNEAPLIDALITGWAHAARAMSADFGETIARWLERRRRQLASGALTVRVGHLDLWAAW